MCAKRDASSIFNWRVDADNDKSLHNWVETLDIHCASSSIVSVIGTLDFAG